MKSPTEAQLWALYRSEWLKNGLGEPNTMDGTNRAVVGFVLGALQMAAGEFTLEESRSARSFDDLRREALRLIGVREFILIEDPATHEIVFYYYSDIDLDAVKKTMEAFSTPPSGRYS